MKNRLNISLKLLTLSLVTSAMLSAATYEENYRVVDLNQSVEKNDNRFMNGNFEKIIRYDMLHFDGNKVDEASQATLDKALEQMKKYKKAGRDFKVTIIGYTNRTTDDANELAIESDSYATAIQNLTKDSFTTKESLDLSKRYAKEVQKSIENAGIKKELTYLEYRGGTDEAYTNATSEGRELSNGVMVSIYLNELVDIDSDRDGVFDRYDRCPGTPRGSKVDKNGCPVDSDKDGVLDYKDLCPETPKGVMVDKSGCPLDSDGDGVVDYKDDCLNTPIGVNVDPNGCPLQRTLKLNFQNRSDKILTESYPAVQEFAEFLKQNPAYSVEITGHTDSRGKAVSNMKLSQQRAAMTKKALVSEGVDASRITTKGRGELDPIESNLTEAGRAANRRIEVKLELAK